MIETHETSQQDMTVQHQRALVGYKELSSWNDRDVQSMVTFDKIFLPITIGAWGLSLARATASFVYVYIVTWLLLTFWVFLSWRYRERIEQRFCVMKKIEQDSGFAAHGLLCNNLKAPRDVTLRWIFYLVVAVLGALEATISVHRNCQLSEHFGDSARLLAPGIHALVFAWLLGLIGIVFSILYFASSKTGRNKE